LKPWVENFTTSVTTIKTMNYCAPPEDKWLLFGLLNNTTQSRILVVLLLPEEEN